eukprot:403361694
MLDDAIREAFNNFPGNSNYMGTTWVYLRKNSNITMHTLKMPLILLSSNYILEPYEYGESNETHATITIYDQGYYRNNTVFNPTLYPNSTPIPYNYQKQIDQGLMTFGEVTDVKFKFVFFNSGIQIQNVTFIEKYSVKYDQMNALFVGHFQPYRWANITNCKFYLFQILMISNKGFNAYFESNFFDISEMQFLAFYTGASDCYIQLTPEIANKQIWNNNYFTGYNVRGRFPLIDQASQGQNMTFTNNKLIDVRWPFNQEGLIYSSAKECDCPPEQKLFYRINYENNTIINSDPSIQSNVAFNCGFTTTYPNLHWEEQDLLSARAEYGIVRNNTFNNTSSASIIGIEFSSGVIENITFINSQSRPGSLNTDSSLISVQNSTNLTIQNIKYLQCNFGNNMAIYIQQSHNIEISQIILDKSSLANNDLFKLSKSSQIILQQMKIDNLRMQTQNDIFIVHLYQVIKSLDFFKESIKIDNLIVQNSQIPLLYLESILDEDNQNPAIKVTLKWFYIIWRVKIFKFNILKLGGVVYVESEGNAQLINSTIKNNFAIEGSIVYVINSQNQITIQEGLIQENGFNYQDDQLLYKCTNLTDILIYIEQSNLKAMNMTFENMQSSTYLVTTKSDGKVNLENVTLVNSQNRPLYTQNNFLWQISVASFTQQQCWYTVNYSDLQFKQRSSIKLYLDQNKLVLYGNLMFFKQYFSDNCEIKKAVNNQTKGLVIKSQHSKIQVSNSKIENIQALSGAFIYTLDDKKNQDEQVQVNITNVVLQNLTSIENGGVAYVSNQYLSIQNSTFNNNEALLSGGSIYIAYCWTNLTGNTFMKNKASISGGGIYYELNEPFNLINQDYSQNESPYGQNYASYPTKLKIINTDSVFLQTLVSGQDLEIAIKIGLFDQNDQIIQTDSESTAQIFSNDIAVSISGETKIKAQNGIFTFDLLNFFAKPNYVSQILFSTEIIDVQKASIINQIQTQLEIKIAFRDCSSGEVNLNNKCAKCTKGIYSFGLKQTQCKQCPPFIQCQGGDMTVVDSGYWRQHNQSIQAFKCLNKQACLQLSIIQSFLEEELIHNVQKVTKVVSVQNVQGILMTLFMVHLNVEDMLTYFSYTSSSQETLLSFDCIYLQLGYQNISSNQLKLILFGILPIILAFIGTVIWFLAKITIKRNDKSFQLLEKIEITAMVVNYLCYPQVITMMFSLFDCYKLDYDISYLKRDMDIICWNDYHNNLILSIGLPFIFIWNLIVPFLIFMKIHIGKNNLDDKTTLQIYGLYYIGLKNEVFYWELIVVNIRKLIFIICSTILATQKAQIRGYLGLLVLYVNNQLCIKFMPFIDQQMNRIEYHATFASDYSLLKMRYRIVIHF